MHLNPPWGSNLPPRAGRVVVSRYAMKRWDSLTIMYNQHIHQARPHVSPLRRFGLKNLARKASYSSTGGSSPDSDERPQPPPLLVLRYCYYRQALWGIPLCTWHILLLTLQHKRGLGQQPRGGLR